MSTETQNINVQLSETAFPQQQNVVMPDAGTGNIALYLAGTGTTLNVYLGVGAPGTQVYYGQNYSYPNTPLPQGISTFPLADGFNIRWASTNGNFKLVWGVS